MRKFNWQTLMDQWQRAHAAAVHEYGVWDCALMAASHIDNLTGTEHYTTHAGQYGDAEASQAYLQSLGFADLDALATDALGPVTTDNYKFAQRGDIVRIDTDLGPALAVVDMTGTRIIGLSPTNTGFIRLPMSLAKAVWRV